MENIIKSLTSPYPKSESDLSLSRKLVQMVRQKPVTRADFDAAALFTLDAVANIIAGQNSGQGKILLEWTKLQGTASGNNITDAGRRALLLGGLCHILEMDDLHRVSVVHPGCIVIPTVWALVETGKADASGHDILRAILAGFEVATRVGMAVGSEHYRIFHNTATCGPFGSAMAAGQLLGLNEDGFVDALGNAGTQAAGLWQFIDTGAMSKHLHAGRGAEAGLVSAELAALGFTGPPEIFEGSRGFFAALAPKGNPDRMIENADAPWQLIETSIKPFPSCRHTHPVIDACTQIRHEMRDSKISLSEIAAVRVDTYQAAIDVCDRATSRSVYEAKFSLQHCTAAALSSKVMDFSVFDEKARDDFGALAKKVELRLSENIDAIYPSHWGCDVRVELNDGQMISVQRRDALGDPELALDKEDMISKARKLMVHGGLEQPDKLISAILELSKDGPLPRLPLQAMDV